MFTEETFAPRVVCVSSPETYIILLKNTRGVLTVLAPGVSTLISRTSDEETAFPRKIIPHRGQEGTQKGKGGVLYIECYREF
jgi:hypothetical protein